MVMKKTYQSLMNPDVNPLRNLPPAQRFQVTVYLSLVWTAIFCAAAGVWFWFGEIVVVHMLIASGFLATGWTFENAKRVTIYRDYPLKDGTARYDDIWGA